ncbi:MAG: glycosyltransferase [Phenylobacterium sp.]
MTCDKFKAAGCKNINQIFQGFEPDIFFNIKPSNKLYDITFIGSIAGINKRRSRYIAMLKRNNLKVFMSKVNIVQSNTIYNKSKICLNFVPAECFSNRVIRIMASGGFLLSQYCSDLNAAFENEQDLVLWKTDEELKDNIGRFLKDHKAREKIAASGNRIIQNFSWANQVQKMLKIVDGHNIIDGAFKGE